MFFAQAIRICESPISRVNTDMNHFSYINSIWSVILTMTTVGYGDIFPRTTIGRFVYFLCAMFGVVVVSMIVVAVMNELDMSGVEEKAFVVVKRMDLRKDLVQESANVICKAFRMHTKIKKKKPIATRDISDFKSSLNDFKEINRAYRQEQHSNINEQIFRQFENIRNTNKEMKMYISVLAQMMEMLMDQNGIADSLKASDSRKMMKVLIHARDKDHLRTLMLQEITRDYRSSVSPTQQTHSYLTPNMTPQRGQTGKGDPFDIKKPAKKKKDEKIIQIGIPVDKYGGGDPHNPPSTRRGLLDENDDGHPAHRADVKKNVLSTNKKVLEKISEAKNSLNIPLRDSNFDLSNSQLPNLDNSVNKSEVLKLPKNGLEQGKDIFLNQFGAPKNQPSHNYDKKVEDLADLRPQTTPVKPVAHRPITSIVSPGMSLSNDDPFNLPSVSDPSVLLHKKKSKNQMPESPKKGGNVKIGGILTAEKVTRKISLSKSRLSSRGELE